MKAREFDIANYNLESTITKIVSEDIKNKISELSIPMLRKGASITYTSVYPSNVLKFEELTKKQQAEVIRVVKAEYDKKKAESKKKYEDIRKQCDEVFYDDKQYMKLLPALEDLYYCQAYTALRDFRSKKERSKAVANAVYQARLMAYSKVVCD